MADNLFSPMAVASFALVMCLMSRLKLKGVLDDEEVREVIDAALLCLEDFQGSTPPAPDPWGRARDLLEQLLESRIGDESR